MPEVTQIAYKHAELITLMLKDRGIHEGHWMLLVNFGFGAGNTGASESEAVPTALVGIQQIGLMRAPAQSALTVDAALVNPTLKVAAKA